MHFCNKEKYDFHNSKQSASCRKIRLEKLYRTDALQWDAVPSICSHVTITVIRVAKIWIKHTSDLACSFFDATSQKMF